MVDQKKMEELHEKYCHGRYAKEMKEVGWIHSLIVWEIAKIIAKKLKEQYGIEADLELLETGALVHDIGFYQCFDDEFNMVEKYVRHGFLGYEILKKEGFDEKTARFALVHTGVGITEEQIVQRNLPLEPRDYIPISLEEEIITYADGFHSKAKVGFNKIEDQLEGQKKHSEEDVLVLKRFVKKFSIPDLKTLEDKYNSWNQKVEEKLKQLHAHHQP